MFTHEIFDIKFPYLTNGGLYTAKILSERNLDSIKFHIFPLNRVDFNRFELTFSNKDGWETKSDYVKQKEFFQSICHALEEHIKRESSH